MRNGLRLVDGASPDRATVPMGPADGGGGECGGVGGAFSCDGAEEEDGEEGDSSESVGVKMMRRATLVRVKMRKSPSIGRMMGRVTGIGLCEGWFWDGSVCLE